jgi:hypothetical protein
MTCKFLVEWSNEKNKKSSCKIKFPTDESKFSKRVWGIERQMHYCVYNKEEAEKNMWRNKMHSIHIATIDR